MRICAIELAHVNEPMLRAESAFPNWIWTLARGRICMCMCMIWTVGFATISRAIMSWALDHRGAEGITHVTVFAPSRFLSLWAGSEIKTPEYTNYAVSIGHGKVKPSSIMSIIQTDSFNHLSMSNPHNFSLLFLEAYVQPAPLKMRDMDAACTASSTKYTNETKHCEPADAGYSLAQATNTGDWVCAVALAHARVEHHLNVPVHRDWKSRSVFQGICLVTGLRTCWYYYF